MSDAPGTLYTVPFSAASLAPNSGGYELLSLYTSSASRVQICRIAIGQKSTSTTLNQQLDVQLLRGTGTGSGSGITPKNRVGWPAAPTAVTQAAGLTTSFASTASAKLIYATATDASGNWEYEPDEAEEITLDASQGFSLRVSSPAATVALSGSLTLKELGYWGSVSSSTAPAGLLRWNGGALKWNGGYLKWK